MSSVLRCLIVGVVLYQGAMASGADTPVATFFRGINLNGPALFIDGHEWLGGDTPTLRCNGNAFENQQVPLKPATDENRSRMIRSSRWGRAIDVDLLQIPPGVYQVFLYVWEDNDSTTFSVLVNDQKVIEQYASGTGGTWKRLGPWRVSPVEGVIRISARAGDANLSGVEVWSGSSPVPSPLAMSFNNRPSDEQVAFFESRVRPVLIERCYSCHSQDAKEIGGELLLDSRVGILKGGSMEPPIVPGNPDDSLLVRAIRHSDPDLKMPPDKPLSSHEIAAIEQWIRAGAPDPRTEDTVAKRRTKSTIDWDKARDFWSLQPIGTPAIPSVKDSAWPAGPIDRFILAKLESADLKPAPRSSKAALLRRVTFDLTGLPPTVEEQNAFEADASPKAYERVVERLLSSPRHGERWGRHWLDVVRYSDTAGDNSDFPIPQMYLYRNWVIDAFNRDLPYDQFIREQLAGDLIGGATTEERHQRLIATGYLANARRFGSRVEDYPWHLTIEDTLDNLGRTFLGMTINCARCHNHKFDPITTDDYYGLYGVFHSTRYPWPGIELEQHQRDLVPLIPVEEANKILDERRNEQKQLDQRVVELDKQRDAAKGEERKALEPQAKEAREKAEAHARQPLPFAQAYAVSEAALIEDSAIQTKGDPAKPGPVVSRHFPTILGGASLSGHGGVSGRQQLADALVDPANPLTARVLVNRVWAWHFGRGLVETPNDFGRQGKRPSNPDLLDHLAREFMNDGWSIKSLHRKIVLSRTYQTSTFRDQQAIQVDPTNELLSAFPRVRLDAESLRDTLLQLGGNLDLSSGAAHPFPPQSDWKFTQHNPFKAIYETNRRSVYLMTQRIQRHPYLAIFDGADPSASTPLRLTSTTPLQALYLLNDPLVHEQAVHFTQRLLGEQTEPRGRIESAYQQMFGRRPDDVEIESSTTFLTQIRAALTASGVTEQERDVQAWQALVRAWMRLNEFVYLD